MKLRKQQQQQPPPPPPPAKPKPSWQHLLEDDERPNREDLAAGHNVFTDSMLEPVPLPKWLRGKRRPPRDRLS